MNAALSPNTQAILLLTAPLIAGKGKSSVRPLSVAEYGQLAQSLRAAGRQPADLLTTRASETRRAAASGFDCERISQLLERGFLLSQALECWQARAIWVVSRADPSYPARFKKRLGNAAPPVLYGCGDAALLDSGGLAVVGSRNTDVNALEYAGSVGRLAARAQCTVISGGARGVDQAAMRGALLEWGTVVGVLADRLERAATDRDNRDALMDGRLVLISPYDPKASFNVGNLMQRNKLVYALADAGLVVASDYNKGGTWEGAVEQLDKLRLAPIYTRAESDLSKGLTALRQKGAIAWPNPQTSEEFNQVRAGFTLLCKSTAPSQGTFSLESEESIVPPADGMVEEETAPAYSAGVSDVDMIAPADALFAKAEELLNGVKTPLRDTDVAEYLDIPKSLAQDWLKRLEQEGKYQRQSRPVRYIRIV